MSSDSTHRIVFDPATVRTPHKHGKLVVPPSFDDGAFDSHATDCPFLFEHDGRYYMTYVGWDGIGYRTGLAVSRDLESWSKVGMIIDRGQAGSATHHNVAMTGLLRENDLFRPATLRKVDGRFVGTYHAYPGVGYEVGPAVIGLCYSEDLRKWEVDEPILYPDGGQAWEAGGLYKSWIMEVDGTFYLFYNAKNQDEKPWFEQTGFATSRDLVRWDRYPGNPVLPIGMPGQFDDIFASDPCVLRARDVWIMFYYGYSSDGHARDGYAVSEDLKTWRKSGEILIDVGPPGTLDDKYASKPAMIYGNDRLYHFYGAVTQFPKRKLGGIEHTEIRGITFATGPESEARRPASRSSR